MCYFRPFVVLCEPKTHPVQSTDYRAFPLRRRCYTASRSSNLAGVKSAGSDPVGPASARPVTTRFATFARFGAVFSLFCTRGARRIPFFRRRISTKRLIFFSFFFSIKCQRRDREPFGKTTTRCLTRETRFRADVGSTLFGLRKIPHTHTCVHARTHAHAYQADMFLPCIRKKLDRPLRTFVETNILRFCRFTRRKLTVTNSRLILVFFADSADFHCVLYDVSPNSPAVANRFAEVYDRKRFYDELDSSTLLRGPISRYMLDQDCK